MEITKLSFFCGLMIPVISLWIFIITFLYAIQKKNIVDTLIFIIVLVVSIALLSMCIAYIIKLVS